jgi:hypothetical protein
MDYRHAAIDTLTDFAEEFSGKNEGINKMSFGDILYSFMRNSSTGLELPIKELNKVRDISDESWYKIVEEAFKNEQEG